MKMQRHTTLAALALVLACVGGQEGGGGDSSLADALDSPRARGSLAGACPAPGARVATGAHGTYANELEEGEYVELTANGTAIDSIDAEFSVHAVGTDSVVFIPIYVDSTGDPPHAESIGEPVLCAAGERLLLRRFLPELDPLFSSPTIADSSVYYWGMRPLTEPGRYFLMARFHHFPTDSVDSLALGELAMFTDDRHHLRPPQVGDDSVIYEAAGNRWAWARDTVTPPGGRQVAPRSSPPSTPPASRRDTPVVPRPDTPAATRPDTPAVRPPDSAQVRRQDTSVARPDTPSVRRPDTASVAIPDTSSVKPPPP